MQDNIAQQALEEHGDFAAAEPVVDVEGLSSPRVCRFLNALVGRMDPGEKYLEIGTWKGLTLMSAAHGNFGRTCIGCDKFRLYGKFTGLGWTAKRALLRNVERYRKHGATVEFHHMTSRRLFAQRRVQGPIGVYFYDGDHSYEGTHHGITAAAPLLSKRAVVLVDDWNDPVIVRATRDAMRDARLEVLWERELAGDHSVRGWWNGLAVFYVARADG